MDLSSNFKSLILFFNVSALFQLLAGFTCFKVSVVLISKNPPKRQLHSSFRLTNWDNQNRFNFKFRKIYFSVIQTLINKTFFIKIAYFSYIFFSIGIIDVLNLLEFNLLINTVQKLSFKCCYLKMEKKMLEILTSRFDYRNKL